MGNAPVHLSQPEEAGPWPPKPNKTNGILAYVGGQYIAAGSAHLPPASEKESTQPVRLVTLDIPGLGSVQITYELNTYGHRRSSHWHWRARRADLLAGK